MSYQLVVSEKPSVGAAYAKVLGATNRQDGYWEGNGYLVSWCIGHLVELAPPNVYDAKYVKWSIADLPILPQKWQYLVSAGTKKQFGICFVETWQRSASCSCVKPASLRSLRTFSPSTFKSEFGIIVHLNSIVSFW